jgi:transposase
VLIDELIPQDHLARTIWAAVEAMPLSAFYERLKARGSTPGRAAADPKVLIALWLYATCRGVGSGRELERLCRECAPYQWLCGSVPMNYHTLNDFRVGHEQALDDLMTEALASLVRHGVVQVRRVSVDGVRVRASAGAWSFRREETIEALLVQARGHIEALKQQMDGATASRRQAARARAAREKKRRLEAALEELPKIAAARAASKHKPSEDSPPRVSSTDPEARVMRMPDKGFRPAYNAQFATDTESRAIVGVDVTNAGTDANLATPMRQQVEQRTGCKVQEQLVDGGYASLQEIEKATEAGTTIFAPPPASRKADSRYTPRTTDSEAVVAWRRRMATDEAKAIYKERSATSETVNADLTTHRGIRQLSVRGLRKARCIMLWFALAYNLMHFGAIIAAT